MSILRSLLQGFNRVIIYSFELKTVGCHSRDDGWLYASRHTHIRAADGHWAAEPLEQEVVMVHALAPAIILPAICRFQPETC